MPPVPVRRLTLPGLALLLLAAAPAAAYTVTLTPAEVQRLIAPQFPQRQEGPWGVVTLSDPWVVMNAGSSRLGLGLVVRAELTGGLQVHGSALVDGEIGYDPQRREFHLREPRVKELKAEGLEEPYASLLAEGVTAIAQAQMPIIVLYRVSDDNPATALFTVLKGAEVRNGRMELELGK